MNELETFREFKWRFLWLFHGFLGETCFISVKFTRMPTHNFQLEASGSSIPVVGKFSLAACPSLYVNAHPIMSAGGLNEWWWGLYQAIQQPGKLHAAQVSFDDTETKAAKACAKAGGLKKGTTELPRRRLRESTYRATAASLVWDGFLFFFFAHGENEMQV